MNKPSELDWVRLAAFIDGEGFIDIETHTQYRPHLKREYTTHRLRIVIVNTDPRLALWLKATFGGCANFEPTKNPKWRHKLVWYLCSRAAADVLLSCLPYLLLKIEQAETALAFQATVTNKVGRAGHTAETIQTRIELQRKLRDQKWARRIADDGSILTVQ